MKKNVEHEFFPQPGVVNLKMAIEPPDPKFFDPFYHLDNLLSMFADPNDRSSLEKVGIFAIQRGKRFSQHGNSPIIEYLPDHVIKLNTPPESRMRSMNRGMHVAHSAVVATEIANAWDVAPPGKLGVAATLLLHDDGYMALCHLGDYFRRRAYAKAVLGENAFDYRSSLMAEEMRRQRMDLDHDERHLAKLRSRSEVTEMLAGAGLADKIKLIIRIQEEEGSILGTLKSSSDTLAYLESDSHYQGLVPPPLKELFCQSVYPTINYPFIRQLRGFNSLEKVSAYRDAMFRSFYHSLPYQVNESLMIDALMHHFFESGISPEAIGVYAKRSCIEITQMMRRAALRQQDPRYLSAFGIIPDGLSYVFSEAGSINGHEISIKGEMKPKLVNVLDTDSGEVIRIHIPPSRVLIDDLPIPAVPAKDINLLAPHDSFWPTFIRIVGNSLPSSSPFSAQEIQDFCQTRFPNGNLRTDESGKEIPLTEEEIRTFNEIVKTVTGEFSATYTLRGLPV